MDTGKFCVQISRLHIDIHFLISFNLFTIVNLVSIGQAKSHPVNILPEMPLLLLLLLLLLLVNTVEIGFNSLFLLVTFTL